jgi:hypothetical protein
MARAHERNDERDLENTAYSNRHEKPAEEPVLERLRDLAAAAGELASAITEQVGPVRTNRLAEALGRVSALLHE